MAALFGRLKGNRGEVTRLGSKASGIKATLETWNGAVEVHLEANGDFTVFIGDKGMATKPVCEGNVDHKSWDGET